MNRTILPAIALLLALDTAHAVRVVELVERAVELSLDELTLPAAGGGTVSFSECASCGISTHRLTDTTVFRANRQTLPFAEFLLVAEEIGQGPDARSAVATVYLDIATGRITRIEVRQ
jgi:hypothetical protein